MLDKPSPNFDARKDGVDVDMLVFHYTGMETADQALERLCDSTAKVSAHYCIDEDGSIYALVDESNRAWHAGVSFWRGCADINGCSIGIELVNPGHEFGYRAFPEPQMTALIDLAGGILSRYAIPSRNVVGHADIAPRRKQDPGELFDWRRLAQAGIGAWPDGVNAFSEPISAVEAEGQLAAIGYETDDLAATLRAFQRRYRPGLVDGVLDRETSAFIQAVGALS